VNLSQHYKVQSSREILAQIELTLKQVPYPNPLRRNFDYSERLTYLEKVKQRLKEKRASIPEHPNKVIISSKYGKLTEKDIWDHYQKFKDEIIEDCKGYDVFFRLSTDGDVFKRKDRGKYIKLNPENYDRLVSGRVVEIHKALPSNQTNLIWVDLDAYERFGDLDKVKPYAKEIQQLLINNFDVQKINVKFSGDRGFHIEAIVPKMDVDEARNKIKDLLKEKYKYDLKVTTGLAAPDQMRLDTSTLHEKGSIKAKYSLHHKTGLVAVPVEGLDSFEPEQAKINLEKTAQSEGELETIKKNKKIEDQEDKEFSSKELLQVRKDVARKVLGNKFTKADFLDNVKKRLKINYQESDKESKENAFGKSVEDKLKNFQERLQVFAQDISSKGFFKGISMGRPINLSDKKYYYIETLIEELREPLLNALVDKYYSIIPSSVHGDVIKEEEFVTELASNFLKKEFNNFDEVVLAFIDLQK